MREGAGFVGFGGDLIKDQAAGFIDGDTALDQILGKAALEVQTARKIVDGRDALASTSSTSASATSGSGALAARAAVVFLVAAALRAFGCRRGLFARGQLRGCRLLRRLGRSLGRGLGALSGLRCAALWCLVDRILGRGVSDSVRILRSHNGSFRHPGCQPHQPSGISGRPCAPHGVRSRSRAGIPGRGSSRLPASGSRTVRGTDSRAGDLPVGSQRIGHLRVASQRALRQPGHQGW